MGVVAAHDKRGADPRFTEDDLRIAEIFAGRAAVAVELSQRVARDAMRRVVAAQELERRRLARELHDETGQALTSILLGLRTVDDARDETELRAAVTVVRDLVRTTLEDVRRLAVELRPSVLDDFGLVAALERLTQTFGEQTDIAVRFEQLLPNADRLPAEVETALYRIVQESLTNVVKHARAANVRIVLARTDDSVSLFIEDDGVGFDPEQPERERHRPRRHAGACRAARWTADNRVASRCGHDVRGGGAAPVIRVLIVDDHALVRSGLRLLLEAEEDVTVEDEAGNAEEAVRKARLHKPDVVLLDIVMPGGSGLDAAPAIKEAAPKSRILVLSMQDDPSYVRQAFSAGANGYLLKEAADAELVAAVREVAAGGSYVHPTLGARLAAAEADAQARAAADPLSDREREVLRLLALGHTNQEIAKMLYISVRTAETHRAHIMQKLRLSTRAELVRYALEHGLLDEAAEPSCSTVLSRTAAPNGRGFSRTLGIASIRTWIVTRCSGVARAARSSPASSSSRRSVFASPARAAGSRRRTTTGSRTRTSSRCTSATGAERLGGRPALVLELASGGPVRIASLGGVGMLIELAEEIGELKAAGATA